MRKPRDPQLKPDEIVSYLKRSRQPTILVEGSDEISVYRHVENELGELDVDVLPCHGRASLLAVFERRSEFVGKQVLYVADQDMWYFAGVPERYQGEILFTLGYSIENDVYNRDLFERLMTPRERVEFQEILKGLAQWQAFHVERYRQFAACSCDVHLNVIFPKDSLCQQHLRSIDYKIPNDSTVQEIFSAYWRAIRGKNLFQAVLRILSSQNRESKYSRSNLLEMGAKSPDSPLLDLVRRIQKKMGSSVLEENA